MQSLNNKLIEISITLSLEETSVNVLCFTEHWLGENQLSSVYIDQFKLVSSFSRSSRTGGGSSILVRNILQTNNVNYITELGSEDNFELSAVELIDFNFTIVCIYRSPNWNVDEFLHKLESVICRVQTRGQNIVLCGDWNINFLQRSTKLLELQNLLLMYNLVNTVNTPTRIMHNTSSLIDVMI